MRIKLPSERVTTSNQVAERAIVVLESIMDKLPRVDNCWKLWLADDNEDIRTAYKDSNAWKIVIEEYHKAGWDVGFGYDSNFYVGPL